MSHKVNWNGDEYGIEFGTYRTGQSPGMWLVDEEGEPDVVASINVPGYIVPEGEILLKGWSENEGLPEALEKSGIVKLTGKTVPCGWSHAYVAKVLIPMEALS